MPQNPNSNRQEWNAALNAHFEQQWTGQRLPSREGGLTEIQEFQCRIIGGTLIDWSRKHGPRLLQERAVLADMMGRVEKDPDIVFVSNLPGLVAAAEILEERPPSMVYLPRESLTAFLNRHPDPDFRWHVEFASWFTPELGAETLARAQAQYPLARNETYWLHHEASTLGPLFGRGGEHLWKWNGTEMALLEEGFNRWVS